jgi:hypothetical protein
MWKRSAWSLVVSFANLRQSTVRFSHDTENAHLANSADTLGRLSAYVCCASATDQKNRESRFKPNPHPSPNVAKLPELLRQHSHHSDTGDNDDKGHKYPTNDVNLSFGLVQVYH